MNVTQYNLIPVRRDQQIASIIIGAGGGSSSMGSSSSVGGGIIYSGGSNISISGSTINVVDSPVFAGDLCVMGNIRAYGDVMAFASECAPINWWDALPIASASVLGGIKVGDGLAISAGVLSATGGSGGNVYTGGTNICVNNTTCVISVCGTVSCASTAGNALALCGCTPACFLGATSPLNIIYTSVGNDAIKICNTNTGGHLWYLGDGAGSASGTFGFYNATDGCLPMSITSTGIVCALTCFTGSGAGLTSVNASSLCGCVPSCFLGATATATCATTAGNALALCGCVPSCFLGAGATATCATVASCLAGHNAGYAYADGGTASAASVAYSMYVNDARDTVTTPQTINQSIVFDFKANSTEGLSDGGSFFGEMTFRQYGSGTDWSGGNSHQLGFTDNGNLWHRNGASTTWGGWRKIITADTSGNVSVGGNLTATGEITAYYSSDENLKCNIKTFCATEIINRIKPVVFNWRDKAKELNTNKSDSQNYGVIAQQLEEVLPQLVHPIYETYKSVDYVQLIPILIQGMKEQQKQIQDLKQEINYMRNYNTEL